MIFVGPPLNLEVDGRGIDGSGSHHLGSMVPSLYGRSASNASSASPPAVTSTSSVGGLIVPQPLPAIAKGQSHTASQNGGGGNTSRKYQCKMCPQVSFIMKSV